MVPSASKDQITVTTVSVLPVSSSYLATSSMGRQVLVQPTVRRGTSSSFGCYRVTLGCGAISGGRKEGQLFMIKAQIRYNCKHTPVSTLHKFLPFCILARRSGPGTQVTMGSTVTTSQYLRQTWRTTSLRLSSPQQSSLRTAVVPPLVTNFIKNINF